jgi:hypothetical protein
MLSFELQRPGFTGTLFFEKALSGQSKSENFGK